MLLNSLISTFYNYQKIKRHLEWAIGLIFLTYFCKKGRHSDCPVEWPMGEPCGGINDCSFDVTIKRCKCDCHQL